MIVQEFEIHQNAALSALALWSFCQEHSEHSKLNVGPNLLATYPVLPLVYDSDFVEATYKRNFDSSGLYKLVLSDGALILRLGKRVRTMFEQTNKALDVAFAGKLLTIDIDQMELLSLRSTPISDLESEECRRILAAARRLGAWFANYQTSEIYKLLKIEI